MLSEHHSLTLGFNVQAPSHRILVYYGERAGDRMDYLTVFPIGDIMRANLFCYLDPGNSWARSFKLNPKQALLEVMPSLERTIGSFEIVGKVRVRPNSIHRAENVRQQAGIVLIGEAYQSSCPAPLAPLPQSQWRQSPARAGRWFTRTGYIATANPASCESGQPSANHNHTEMGIGQSQSLVPLVIWTDSADAIKLALASDR